MHVVGPRWCASPGAVQSDKATDVAVLSAARQPVPEHPPWRGAARSGDGLLHADPAAVSDGQSVAEPSIRTAERAAADGPLELAAGCLALGDRRNGDA